MNTTLHGPYVWDQQSKPGKCDCSLLSVHCCLVVTCWEGAVLLALVGDVYCIFVTFPCGILGQVWLDCIVAWSLQAFLLCGVFEKIYERRSLKISPDLLPMVGEKPILAQLFPFLYIGFCTGDIFLPSFDAVIYSTAKETHQSLLVGIMEIRIKKWKYVYTIFRGNQFCIISLNNVTVLLKSVHAIRQC